MTIKTLLLGKHDSESIQKNIRDLIKKNYFVTRAEDNYTDQQQLSMGRHFMLYPYLHHAQIDTFMIVMQSALEQEKDCEMRRVIALNIDKVLDTILTYSLPMVFKHDVHNFERIVLPLWKKCYPVQQMADIKEWLPYISIWHKCKKLSTAQCKMLVGRVIVDHHDELQKLFTDEERSELRSVHATNKQAILFACLAFGIDMFHVLMKNPLFEKYIASLSTHHLRIKLAGFDIPYADIVKIGEIITCLRYQSEYPRVARPTRLDLIKYLVRNNDTGFLRNYYLEYINKDPEPYGSLQEILNIQRTFHGSKIGKWILLATALEHKFKNILLVCAGAEEFYTAGDTPSRVTIERIVLAIKAQADQQHLPTMTEHLPKEFLRWLVIMLQFWYANVSVRDWIYELLREMLRCNGGSECVVSGIDSIPEILIYKLLQDKDVLMDASVRSACTARTERLHFGPHLISDAQNICLEAESINAFYVWIKDFYNAEYAVVPDGSKDSDFYKQYLRCIAGLRRWTFDNMSLTSDDRDCFVEFMANAWDNFNLTANTSNHSMLGYELNYSNSVKKSLEIILYNLCANKVILRPHKIEVMQELLEGIVMCGPGASDAINRARARLENENIVDHLREFSGLCIQQAYKQTLIDLVYIKHNAVSLHALKIINTCATERHHNIWVQNIFISKSKLVPYADPTQLDIVGSPEVVLEQFETNIDEFTNMLLDHYNRVFNLGSFTEYCVTKIEAAVIQRADGMHPHSIEAYCTSLRGFFGAFGVAKQGEVPKEIFSDHPETVVIRAMLAEIGEDIWPEQGSFKTDESRIVYGVIEPDVVLKKNNLLLQPASSDVKCTVISLRHEICISIQGCSSSWENAIRLRDNNRICGLLDEMRRSNDINIDFAEACNDLLAANRRSIGPFAGVAWQLRYGQSQICDPNKHILELSIQQGELICKIYSVSTLIVRSSEILQVVREKSNYKLNNIFQHLFDTNLPAPTIDHDVVREYIVQSLHKHVRLDAFECQPLAMAMDEHAIAHEFMLFCSEQSLTIYQRYTKNNIYAIRQLSIYDHSPENLAILRSVFKRINARQVESVLIYLLSQKQTALIKLFMHSNIAWSLAIAKLSHNERYVHDLMNILNETCSSDLFFNILCEPTLVSRKLLVEMWGIARIQTAWLSDTKQKLQNLRITITDFPDNDVKFIEDAVSPYATWVDMAVAVGKLSTPFCRNFFIANNRYKNVRLKTAAEFKQVADHFAHLNTVQKNMAFVNILRFMFDYRWCDDLLSVKILMRNFDIIPKGILSDYVLSILNRMLAEDISECMQYLNSMCIMPPGTQQPNDKFNLMVRVVIGSDSIVGIDPNLFKCLIGHLGDTEFLHLIYQSLLANKSFSKLPMLVERANKPLWVKYSLDGFIATEARSDFVALFRACGKYLRRADLDGYIDAFTTNKDRAELTNPTRQEYEQIIQMLLEEKRSAARAVALSARMQFPL